MNHDMERVQDFSDWTGQPFFEGAPAEGRHVYVVRKDEEGRFLAFGTIDGTHPVLFAVRGANEEELRRFLVAVKEEGARVTFGLPPFDTNTGPEKPIAGESRPGRGPIFR